MTRHDDEVRLRHMLDHAQEALSMVSGKKRQDFGQNRMLELALVRLIEIIGEAAARVTPEGQGKVFFHSLAADYWNAESADPRL